TWPGNACLKIPQIGCILFWRHLEYPCKLGSLNHTIAPQFTPYRRRTHMEETAVKESKYRDVHIAARRARQLQSGASPIVPTRSTKAVRIAQDEVEAG